MHHVSLSLKRSLSKPRQGAIMKENDFLTTCSFPRTGGQMHLPRFEMLLPHARFPRQFLERKLLERGSSRSHRRTRRLVALHSTKV